MANGFFLGGLAEGAQGAQRLGLAERAQTEQTGLATRGLELQEAQFQNTVSQQAQAEADKLIGQTMGVVSETIKNAIAVGRPPEQIIKAVTPLVQSAQAIAAKVGRDPAALTAQVQAEIARPGLVETAEVGGTAGGRQRVATEAAVQQVPLPAAPRAAPAVPGTATTAPIKIDVSPFADPKDRVAVEGSLRDDYTKMSGRFITVRDFYDRMQSATDSGPGDITRIFAFMKMQDPESAVREKEYATAENASGVPEAIRNMYNKLLLGDKLGPEARRQIMAEAKQIWTGAAARQSSLTNQFAKIAKRSGVRPENVIVDLTSLESTVPPPPQGFIPVTPRR